MYLRIISYVIIKYAGASSNFVNLTKFHNASAYLRIISYAIVHVQSLKMKSTGSVNNVNDK